MIDRRRNAKGGEEAQIAALIALGFTSARAHDILHPPHWRSVGFASFELTNNNANIRRMKERLEHIERVQTVEATELEGENARLEDDPAANRVRLIFPDKPDAEIRAKLKKRGFRWAPSVGAWQAYRNTMSLELAHEIAGVVTE